MRNQYPDSDAFSDVFGWRCPVCNATAYRQTTVHRPNATAEKSEQRRLFVPVKNNLGRNVGGLPYRIRAANLKELSGGSAAAIEWEDGKVDTTAAEVLTPQVNTRETKTDEAIEFLRDLLHHGEVSAKVAINKGHDAGFSTSAIHRARQALGVTTRKDGQGGWFWKSKRAVVSLNSSESSKPWSGLKFKNRKGSKNSKTPRFRLNYKGRDR